MTAAPTWPFPGGRILHSWWRDLSAWQPQRLWISHLLFHRVEALATVVHTQQLDPFEQALLQRVGAAERHSSLVSLDDFHVERQLLSQWLGALERRGLLQAKGPTCVLTAAGRHAVATGDFTQTGQERRVFYFVENPGSHPPVHFLALSQPAIPYPTPSGDWRFNPHWLARCLHQSAEWKRRYQFPTDVVAIVGTESAPGPLPWRQVILDRPEQMSVALIQTRNTTGASTLHGFEVNTEDWKLRHDQPFLTVAADWEVVLPELTEEPPLDSWRSSWQSWCRQRKLPAIETDACPLRCCGFQLEVSVPKPLFERWRVARSDVLHGNTWLLAGEGRTRTAACLQIMKAEV